MSSIRVIAVPGNLLRESSDAYLERQNGLFIEDYFRRWMRKNSGDLENNGLEWNYLPIGWTALESRYRGLPRPLRKYFGLGSLLYKRLNRKLAGACAGRGRVFTVCQHARGVEIDKRVHRPENLLVFSCGGTGHIPLPLLCDKCDHPTVCRDLIASFQGVVSHPQNHYPWRQAMAAEFTGKKAIAVIDTAGEGAVRTDYLELMARSRFCLCPRGYGRTSFRLMEAMHAGCVPVYIHAGDPWLPYQDLIDWTEFCVLVDYRRIDGLHDHLANMPSEQVEKMSRRAKQVADDYFTLEFSSRYVISKLNQYAGASVAEVIRASAGLREQQGKDQYIGR